MQRQRVPLPHSESVVVAGLSSRLFSGGVYLFVFHTPSLRRLAGLCWPAGLGRNRHFAEHRGDFQQAIVDVLALVAGLFAVEHEFTGDSESTGKPGQKTLANRLGQRWRRCGVPSENRLAVHLINVLATRSTAAGKRKRELAVRNADSSRDFQHIHNLLFEPRGTCAAHEKDTLIAIGLMQR